eukprot:jgi/Pico_ML_1/55730/g1379.t1
MRWRRLEADSPPSSRRGHAVACVRSEAWDGGSDPWKEDKEAMSRSNKDQDRVQITPASL